MKTFLFFFLFIFYSFFLHSQSTILSSINPHRKGPRNFASAKNLLKKVYFDELKSQEDGSVETFYCSCPVSQGGNINFGGGVCNYTPVMKPGSSNLKYGSRNNRNEWDHVIPFSILIDNIKSFSNSKYTIRNDPEIKRLCKKLDRACILKYSSQARIIEADIYNLVPSIGALNAYKSNYMPAEIAGEDYIFGGCSFEVSNRKFEPASEIKGDIARIYFHLKMEYGFEADRKFYDLMVKWQKLDPISSFECLRIETLTKYTEKSQYYTRNESLCKSKLRGTS